MLRKTFQWRKTKNAGVCADIECMVSEGSVESVKRMQNSGNGDGSGPIAHLHGDESLGGCCTRLAWGLYGDRGG